jgi:hypothetical protein
MAGAEDTLRKDRDLLRQELHNAIGTVRRVARRYRRLSGTLLLTAMVCGALGTLLAGEAFRGGALAANVAEQTTGRVPSELPRGWRNVCGIIAILTFIGTVATATNSIMKLADNQTKAVLCAGSLDALETELLREADLRRPVLDKVATELVKVRREHADFFL